MSDRYDILQTISSGKCKLVKAMDREFDKGVQAMDSVELGRVADIIKDLSEAEYYCTVVEAMRRGEEPTYGYPMGYNPNRGDDGRYTDGRGRENGSNMRMGYRPFMDPQPYVDAYMHDPMFSERMHGSDRGEDRRYGDSYNKYRQARRGYSTTGSAEDKMRMEEHATEHLHDTVATLKEIHANASPEMRKRLKSELTALANSMTA